MLISKHFLCEISHHHRQHEHTHLSKKKERVRWWKIKMFESVYEPSRLACCCRCWGLHWKWMRKNFNIQMSMINAIFNNSSLAARLILRYARARARSNSEVSWTFPLWHRHRIDIRFKGIEEQWLTFSRKMVLQSKVGIYWRYRKWSEKITESKAMKSGYMCVAKRSEISTLHQIQLH